MADLWPVMFYNPWLALRRRRKVMLFQLLLTDVHAIFTLNRPWFWLAGNDIDVEGDWRWVTSGQVVSFNNWMGGRPNNAGGNQHCMSYTHPHGKWRDDFCTYRIAAFCEIWCSFETMTDMKKCGGNVCIIHTRYQPSGYDTFLVWFRYWLFVRCALRHYLIQK